MEIKDYLFKNKYDFQFVDLQSNKKCIPTSCCLFTSLEGR